MIDDWMLRAMLIATLLACAGMFVDRVAVWYGAPRRYVWCAVMACSLALPALAWWAPDALPHVYVRTRVAERAASSAEDEPPFAAQNSAAIGAASTTFSAAARRPRVAVTVWAVGSLASTLVMVLVYLRLASIRRRAVASTLDGVAVRVTTGFGPAVIGYRSPAILVPRWVLGAAADERRIILSHEQEHIRARDPWMLALGVGAIAAMPWNPALWWQFARLRFAVEADCDARVVAHGVDRGAYGRTLIRAAEAPRATSLLAPAWRARSSHLAARIRALTARAPEQPLRRAIPFAAIAIAMFIAACEVTAPVRTVERGPAPRPAMLSSDDAVPLPTPLYGLTTFSSVRVTGFGRETMRVRLTLTADSARSGATPSDGRNAAQSIYTVEFETPAEFRVVGASRYRLVAEALEPGSQVEIAGTSPPGFGAPRAASARGTAPMLNFTRAAPDSGIDSRLAHSQTSPQLVRLPVATAAGGTRAFGPAEVQLRPGHIRVVAADGRPARVRVGMTGARVVDLHPDRARGIASGELELVTPVDVALPRDSDYVMRFVSANPATALRMVARGGAGFGFNSSSIQGGVLLACRNNRGAGVMGGDRNVPFAEVTCAW